MAVIRSIKLIDLVTIYVFYQKFYPDPFQILECWSENFQLPLDIVFAPLSRLLEKMG